MTVIREYLKLDYFRACSSSRQKPPPFLSFEFNYFSRSFFLSVRTPSWHDLTLKYGFLKVLAVMDTFVAMNWTISQELLSLSSPTNFTCSCSLSLSNTPTPTPTPTHTRAHTHIHFLSCSLSLFSVALFLSHTKTLSQLPQSLFRLVVISLLF